MKLISDTRGQGTVEAAIVIPVLFLLLLMLLQPGIILYDLIVMNNAAAEGARLAVTADSSSGTAGCVEFIKNRLSAVPEHDLFHIHSRGCAWDIQIQGGGAAEETQVLIKNQLRPLPLFDATLALLGITNAAGNIEICARCKMPGQPSWLSSSGGVSSPNWVEAW